MELALGTIQDMQAVTECNNIATLHSSQLVWEMKCTIILLRQALSGSAEPRRKVSICAGSRVNCSRKWQAAGAPAAMLAPAAAPAFAAAQQPLAALAAMAAVAVLEAQELSKAPDKALLVALAAALAVAATT